MNVLLLLFFHCVKKRPFSERNILTKYKFNTIQFCYDILAYNYGSFSTLVLKTLKFSYEMYSTFKTYEFISDYLRVRSPYTFHFKLG